MQVRVYANSMNDQLLNVMPVSVKKLFVVHRKETWVRYGKL